MTLKKQHFSEGEIPIFDEACIYKRGDYWEFLMWLPKENKYARKSLRTRSEATAIEKGKTAYLEYYDLVIGAKCLMSAKRGDRVTLKHFDVRKD